MTKLLDKLSNPLFLRSCWDKLNKSNPNSKGISDENIESFKDNLESRIESISVDLKSGTYYFNPTRASLVPKKPRGFRALQIPEVRDRIVIKGIAILLESIFADDLGKMRGVSFAYQKKLGIKEASERIRDLIDNANYFVLEVDLMDFFGTVNNNKLLNETIIPKLPDSSITNLLKESINQPVVGYKKFDKQYHEKFQKLNSGIPQGNALSPLLSNIYLLPFDKTLIARKINLVRYADDFVILTKTLEEAQEAYRISHDILENKLGLEIHKEGEKAYSINNIKNRNFEFLSVEHSLSDKYPSESAISKLIEKISDEVKSGVHHKNLYQILYKLKWLLDGWSSAFYFTNIEKHSEILDYTINRHLYRAFQKLDLRISKKNLGKIPNRLKPIISNSSPECLTNKQRNNLGILLMNEYWKKYNLKVTTDNT